MITQEHIDRILDGNGNVVDQDGNKVGSAGQVYVDDHTGEPSWVTVKTGLFGTSESFAPLQGASMDGDDVRIAYTKDQVKDAPKVDPDQNLSEAEEEELYRHYSLSRQGGGYDAADHGTYSGTTTGSDDLGDTSPGIAGVGERDRYDADRGDRDLSDTDRGDRTVGHDTSGPTTDDAMTRSEERLHVGTENRETGRARLRKYVVTENVTKTVPVQREEVRVEREPITDANRGDALDGPAISEEEHEVTLHEERPVVEKEAVPVERVRLDKETVTDEQTVSEEVRKEEIETDGTDDTRRGI
ncbi:YsnF/AvaK domain-containing protein [uncultured Arthrobacter sp.]|uniref:YsnF/AvaK domain-containing protein n=1 Tax=uncultured Arthrobacter sp. TaxID=114050 RepID=UPI0026029740|nr:YsnF/AvaK domain-containing protein [uncultured Arthrobacter sp.]